MRVLVVCVATRCDVVFTNTHSGCAERRLLEHARAHARRTGVAPHAFAFWLHRRYGQLVVWRHTRDGTPAASLPCVLCRRALDAVGARWTAHAPSPHADTPPVRVTDANAPPSKLTHWQAAKMFAPRDKRNA